MLKSIFLLVEQMLTYERVGILVDTMHILIYFNQNKGGILVDTKHIELLKTNFAKWQTCII